LAKRYGHLKLHKTRGHPWKIVKQRNCLDLRKHFSLRLTDQEKKLDQEDIDCEPINGFKNQEEVAKDTEYKDRLFMTLLDSSYSDPTS